VTVNLINKNMTPEVSKQVEDYAKNNYRLLFGKDDTLTIKEYDSHFTVVKSQTGSPLILGKTILEN
jgi:hypothetical protein